MGVTGDVSKNLTATVAETGFGAAFTMENNGILKSDLAILDGSDPGFWSFLEKKINEKMVKNRDRFFGLALSIFAPARSYLAYLPGTGFVFGHKSIFCRKLFFDLEISISQK